MIICDNMKKNGRIQHMWIHRAKFTYMPSKGNKLRFNFLGKF